jgi:orotate phosphoribosyltransferase
MLIREGDKLSDNMGQSWEERFTDLQATWDYCVGGWHAADLAGTKHMDYYFNSNYVVKHPHILESICTSVFVPELLDRKIQIDWVISYPPFGLPVAFCLANILKSNFAYCENEELRFDLKPGQKVLIVADDIYTGKSLENLMHTLSSRGVLISDLIMVLGNFIDRAEFAGKKVVSAVSRSVNLWQKGECPLCKSGSQAVSARSNWQELLQNREQVQKRPRR